MQERSTIKKEDFDAFLYSAVKKGASDIHLKTGSPPSVRVNGVLIHLNLPPISKQNIEAITGYILSSKINPPSINEITQIDLSYTTSPPIIYRFRVSIFKQRGNLSIVFRNIPAEIPTFQSLGLPPVIEKISQESRGLILITGATGSGKSSTLAAIINYINHTKAVHIITIEDPIEFIHEDIKARISQREVGTDTENFNSALRAALRQDPDVILVGEIRDHETIDIALKAAETGHLVLSTLHTPDAAKTLGRILALFPPEEQELVRHRLADNLTATISQRLLPRADGKGRVVAMEIMIVTGTVREWLIQMEKPSTIKDIIEKSRTQYEMQTFDQSLTDLYRGGLVTLEAAKAAATNPADFIRALNFE